MLCILLGAPLSASAGIFSFVAGLIGTPVSAEVRQIPAAEMNSQTIPLLRAAANIDPNPSKGGGDITVVNDSALLPDTGPSGAVPEDSGASADAISLYVVREGDTLAGIAQMFNVSENTIRWANDLKIGAAISPGTTLTILPITGIRHTVAANDTIAGIAAKYSGDADEILSFNHLAPDAALEQGTVVVIPDGESAAPAPAKKAEAAKSTKSGKGAPVVRSAPSSCKGGGSSGYFGCPVPGGTRTQGLHGYNGVDIGAPVGTSVMASAAGTVIVSKASGWNGGYGSYIVIKHSNGSQTLYAHLSADLVSVGDTVVRGQVIGKVGTSGKATGPHLHFEVRGATNPF